MDAPDSDGAGASRPGGPHAIAWDCVLGGGGLT